MKHRMDSCPHCGCLLAKARSRPDHNRLFALIDKAFMHWPEGRDFQPQNAEHLRAYLLVRAGHFNAGSIEVPEGYADSPAIRNLYRVAVDSTARALAGPTGYYDLRVTASGIEVLTARSINEQTVVGQKAFGPIREAVEALIEEALGVKAHRLLRENAA